MGVLPEGFKVNSTNGYMRLKNGENRFRILDSAIGGIEWWIEENGKRKPMRRKPGERISPNELGADSKPKQFIAFVVWNYADEAIQILQLSQKGIMKELSSYEADPEWGDLKDYDIKIIRTGEGYDTQYQTIPAPKKAVNKDIIEAYKNTPVNLDALFTNEDPFASEF